MIGKLCDVCGEHEAVQIACSAYGATSYAFCPKCLRPSCSDFNKNRPPEEDSDYSDDNAAEFNEQKEVDNER